MDIFNKNKVRELEEIIERQERQLEVYRKSEEEKQSKRHNTGAWCEGCQNLIIHNNYGCYPTQFCMLDNECADRKPKA